MRPLDPRLLTVARATRGYLLACAAIGAGTAGLVIAQAFLLADAVASVTLATVPLLVVVVAARGGLAFLQEVCAHRASAAVKSALRQRLVRRCLELGPAWLAGERRPALTTLATSGLDSLDAYFARYLPQLVLAVVVPLAVTVVLFGADPVAAGTVAVTVPLIPVFMALVGLATAARTRRRWFALEVLAHHFADVVAGLPTLKIFGRAKAQALAVARVSDRYRRESLATLRIAFLSSLVLELLATLSVALVAVGVGIRLVEGTLDLRTALVVLVLAPEAYLPLRLVGTHFHASADGLAAVEQVLRVLETEPASRRPARVPAKPAGGKEAALTVRDLKIRYDGSDRPAVTCLSVTARPGEVVALSGPSGSGKSSTLAAILGFVRPTAGTIIAGRYGWLPQRPYLFAGTIAENVRLARAAATDVDVKEALTAAGAGELAPERRIGEAGQGLSAGEARRVALARALVNDPELLLLDEPTAGLDPVTEQDVATTLAELRQAGKAILLVSHRPAMLSIADKTCVLG